MENKKEMSPQDRAKIESLVTMSIANHCYEKLENNSDFELVPVYCSMFIGNSQKGEIALLQAYNVSRQLGRPTSVSALMNILFQNNCICYTDKVKTVVNRTVIGYNGTISLKDTVSDNIEFNVLILTKKAGNGIEVVKLQVYDKPLEVNKEKDMTIVLPWCHNIFIEEDVRNETRDEIMNAARMTAEKIDQKLAEEKEEINKEAAENVEEIDKVEESTATHSGGSND